MNKSWIYIIIGVFFISFASSTIVYQENMDDVECADGWAIGSCVSVCQKTYDANWGVPSPVPTCHSYGSAYYNYTKPARVLNSSLWQIGSGYGISNLTILQSCWDYNVSNIQFKYDSSNWYCNNGTWNNLAVTDSAFEEAMWWEIWEITLPFYANLTQKLENTTLNLNVSLSPSNVTNSSCVIEANGTNQTFSISNNWCNATINLTGLVSGDHVINVWVNDSLGNFFLNDSYFVNIPTGKPAITINSPVGIKTSTNVSFDFTIATTGTLDYCSYNVTTQPGIVVVPENSINCSNLLEYQQIGDAGGVNYIVNVFANDTLGNNNTFSALFSVSVYSAPISSGGGGGTPIIEPDELTFGKPESICAPFKVKFGEALAVARTQDKIIDKLKTIWISFWDYVLCSSTASIYPI